MSQRRIRPSVLYENNYGTRYPSPTERTLDASVLNGGLNLWELSYRLNSNQSPDLENMYWNDGCLSSRPGQSYIFEQAAAPATQYGDFKACYDKLWPDDDGYIIAHKGSSIYKIDPDTGAHTELISGLGSTTGGAFFVFGKDAKLYYLSGSSYSASNNGKEYIEITKAFVASAVTGFVPTTVMNRTPAGTGGNVYQPENRISAGKRVLFTQDSTTPATDFYLPYQGLDATGLIVKVLVYSEGSYNWVTYTEVPDVTAATGDVYQVDRTNGIVKFKTAPTHNSNNEVDITCYKTDSATFNSIYTCTHAVTYGGGNDVCVVVGGCSAQPNAYFWSGNNETEVTATYFPFDQYNYAGNNSLDKVTGFGIQQSMLVIFQEHQIGKSSLSTETVNERLYLNLAYTGMNAGIGCDISGSIKLVNNNLVFANSYNGVYVLLDTTAAGENNVKRISRNINGDGLTKGLLKDLREANYVSSFDDGDRYWICVNSHIYLWSYSIAGISSKEENMSWFYFTNISPSGWVKITNDSMLFFKSNGSLVGKNDSYEDFGGSIFRRYTFATFNFGTYEYLKDVMKVVLSVRSDTNCRIDLSYSTDYETRYDLTPIEFYTWRLVPRDLRTRRLTAYKYAMSAIRLPRCRHIRHFSMEITNNTAKTDMSLIGAQIVYRYVREDR